MPYLGASLSLLAVALSAPVQAQDAKPFQDVPQSHWAYEAVNDLQSKGIIIGYPDGYFRGKRTLTRYEFAVALKRALDKIPTSAGPAGPAGPAGEQGPAGPPGVTPEELANFRRLADEFRNELQQLGANVKDISNRLDALAKDVADIKDYLARQPKFSGDFFGGFRSDRSRDGFLDYSGAGRAANPSHFENVNALHDFHLNVAANLPGGVKFNGDATFSNYLTYRNSGTPGGGFLGGQSNAARSGNQGAEQVNLYHAELGIPIGGFGSGTVLTVGRFKNSITPLTYYRPDTDAYFDLPWYDDGNYIEDGFKLESRFGSARTLLFAGSYQTTTSSSVPTSTINSPLVGAVYGFNGDLLNGNPRKPFGLVPSRGQIAATQSAGLHVGVPIARIGELGVTLVDFTGNATGTGFAAGVPFNNVVLYGANFRLNQIGHFTFNAEGAKTVTQNGISNTDGNYNEDNNAFTLNAGYKSGPLGVEAGYQYIDPRFAAPGYWNKIGNWYNPTNVQGPFARVNYNFNHALVGFLGGDYYAGARNRANWSTGSSVARGTAGVKYTINRLVTLGGQYEGVFYDYTAGLVSGNLGGGRSKPVEQYITINAGLNLASNTVLKLAYQIISDNGGNLGGGVSQSGLNYSNASVFTTQLAVHF